MCVLFLQGLKLCAVFCVNKKKAVGKKSSWMFVQSLVDAVYYVFWVFQKEKEGGKCVTLCTAHKCSVILFMGYKNVHQ